MEPALQFNASLSGSTLQVCGIDLSDLFVSVMEQGVAVLKGAFPRHQLTEFRSAVHQWGLSKEMAPPQTNLPDRSFHSLESGISPRQKTPHVYHAYNFNEISALPTDLQQRLLSVFDVLLDFQNRLTGNTAAYNMDLDGRKARPQIIHYPSGGGMFGRHIHLLEPQRIGLILGLSERGVDFSSGATHFEFRGNRIKTDKVHDVGDLILFRFDIPHWITAVDQGEKFDPSSARGRWTAVLPYY